MLQPEGYSGKPLAQKLGVKSGMRVDLLNGPSEYETWVPEASVIRNAIDRDARFVHGFVVWRKDLEAMVVEVTRHLAPDGMFWISWPKKASKKPTDIDEQTLRDVCLPTGLVDVKVCAVDATWSGLKFYFRLSARDKIVG